MNFTNLLVSGQDFILPAILLVLLVVSAVMAFMRRSKYTQTTMEMKNNLKIGDKVKTYAGMYGEIVDIKEALDGSKYLILKSGEGEFVSYFSIDIEAIYGIDFKDDVDETETQEVAPENIKEEPLPETQKEPAQPEVILNGETQEEIQEVKEKKTRKPRTTKKEN